MSSIYPKAPEPASLTPPLSDDDLATKIIAAREADPNTTKALAIASIIDGPVDLDAYYRVWRAIDKEKIALRALTPTEKEKEVDYRARLQAVTKYLDADLWYNGLLAEQAIDFEGLKSSV
jgi:hypothetical protein